MKYIWLLILAVSMYSFGWFSHGWYIDSIKLSEIKKDISIVEEVKTDVANNETKAAGVKIITETKYKVINRDVVRYLQSPDRNVCNYDANRVRAKQDAIDAANSISRFTH